METQIGFLKKNNKKTKTDATEAEIKEVADISYEARSLLSHSQLPSF